MQTSGKSSLEAFLNSTQVYGKTTLELSKLKGLHATANVVSILAARLCLLIAAILFIVVISIGVALWLNELIGGKSYYGFFILSAFYFVLVLVFYIYLHRWIKQPLSDLIISQALD